MILDLGCGEILTDEHAASSYGQPVVVGKGGRLLDGGEAKNSIASYLNGMVGEQHPEGASDLIGRWYRSQPDTVMGGRDA